MPRFGLAHKLLSSRHPDTSPPAGGADPDDGQVVTWSDALRAFHAADPAGGVTDHGALTGLVPDDDHTQYTLLAGRAAGQSLLGGLAASEHLTLQSTAHATRGYVRAQDDLQLLSNIIRDSGGNARLTLAAASPHVALTGDLDITGHLAAGNGAAVLAGYVLRAVDTIGLHPCAAAHFEIHGDKASGPQFAYGIAGSASGEGGTGPKYVYGLYFSAIHNSSATTGTLGAIAVQIQSGASGSGAIAIARGFHLSAGYWGGSKPTTVRGLDIEDQGGAGAGTAEAIKALDQTATTVRLLELGPAVPYLRVVGGAAPGASNTNVYMSEGAGPTLRRLQTKDGAAIVGGDLVCVLV